MYPGEWAERRTNEPLFVFEPSGTVVTFAEYERDANRMAHLRDSGLALRDHVALMVENRPSCSSPRGRRPHRPLLHVGELVFPADELAHIVNDCGARRGRAERHGRPPGNRLLFV
ncbi:MAG: hypothetical protein U0W40_02825 [Acidimicrobiia bacterium]